MPIKQSAERTARVIFNRFKNNEDNVQEKAKESPEFYRCIMYTLYPEAEAIDGTDEYHDIVDELEELFQ